MRWFSLGFVLLFLIACSQSGTDEATVGLAEFENSSLNQLEFNEPIIPKEYTERLEKIDDTLTARTETYKFEVNSVDYLFVCKREIDSISSDQHRDTGLTDLTIYRNNDVIVNTSIILGDSSENIWNQMLAESSLTSKYNFQFYDFVSGSFSTHRKLFEGDLSDKWKLANTFTKIEEGKVFVTYELGSTKSESGIDDWCEISKVYDLKTEKVEEKLEFFSHYN